MFILRSKKLPVLLLCALSVLSGYSQSSVTNPFLEESLKQALEKNGLIKEQNLLIQQQQAGYNLATRQFGPEVTLGTSYSLAAGGRSISFPLGDLLNPVSNALNDLTSSNDFHNTRIKTSFSCPIIFMICGQGSCNLSCARKSKPTG